MKEKKPNEATLYPFFFPRQKKNLTPPFGKKKKKKF